MGRRPKKYESMRIMKKPYVKDPMILDLKKVVRKAVAVKKHLKTHMNGKDSKFLLISIKKEITIVRRYCEKIDCRPFDWKSKKFTQPGKWTRTGTKNIQDFAGLDSSSHDVVDNICKSAMNGLAPITIVSVGSSKKGGMVEPTKDSNRSTLSGLKRLLARTTPSTLVNPLLAKGHACIPPLLDPNRTLSEMNGLPFNEKEKKLWLEFTDSVKGTPEVRAINPKFVEEEKRSIELDHPIVRIIGDFAVAAFNKACEMHVKKGVHKNIHDFEYMECKYLKTTKAYCFYMIIEAVEEGNLGVYETKILCSIDDGRRTLVKFVLTDCTPVGTKAMAISHFSRMASVGKILEGATRDKLIKMKKIYDVTKGKDKVIAMSQIAHILELHDKTVKGIHHMLDLDRKLLFPPDCIRTTNRAGWSHPDEDSYSGMIRRTKGTPCMGYDYYNFLWHGQVI